MMLCQADFEDLFPDLFPGDTRETEAIRLNAPSAHCVTRWKDDAAPLHATPQSGRLNASKRPPLQKEAARHLRPVAFA
ncbi:hypothetical protein [Gymnodinialimonas sp. 57CJ19]|uniref:hypothetical protein n=1 Tax=Gymnodinialimonas sp. 57CJ19 TaxID=3138498 RepID=UPI00313439FA